MVDENGDGNTGTGSEGASTSGGAGATNGSKESAASIRARAGGAFSAGKPVAEGTGDGAAPANREAAGEQGRAAEGVSDGGETKRPETVPEKFWDAAKGEAKWDELAKAYTTLESSFASLKQSKGLTGEIAKEPGGYLKEGVRFSEESGLQAIDPNDPAVNAMRNVAHRLKIPVDLAHSLAAEFLTEINPILPTKSNADDIVKELGPSGEVMRDRLLTWMDGQYDAGLWSAAEYEWACQRFGSDAVGIRFLGKLREQMGEKPIPLGRPVGDNLPTQEEWYKMAGSKRYAEDVGYREKVDQMGEIVIGTEPAGTSPAGLGVGAGRPL